MREDDYKDERWLKRANEIRRLDGYKCAKCGKSDVELHVHHLAYPPKPFHIWDATDDELVSLCKNCHFAVHNLCKSRPKLTADRNLQYGWKDRCWECMHYKKDIYFCENCGGEFFRSIYEYYDSLRKSISNMSFKDNLHIKTKKTSGIRQALGHAFTLRAGKAKGFSIKINKDHD